MSVGLLTGVVDFPTVIGDASPMRRRSGVEVPNAARLFGGAPGLLGELLYRIGH